LERQASLRQRTDQGRRSSRPLVPGRDDPGELPALLRHVRGRG
jgi:hypothetical protein